MSGFVSSVVCLFTGVVGGLAAVGGGAEGLAEGAAARDGEVDPPFAIDAGLHVRAGVVHMAGAHLAPVRSGDVVRCGHGEAVRVLESLAKVTKDDAEQLAEGGEFPRERARAGLIRIVLPVQPGRVENGGGNSGLLGFVVLVGEQKGSNEVTYKIFHVLASSCKTFPPIFVVKKIWSHAHLLFVN